MTREFIVREEEPYDWDEVRRVHDLAFGTKGEGKLVDRLREEDLVIASVVAIAGGEVVGHALFSPMPIELAEQTLYAAALAPVAVLPEWQGIGIGSALIRHGLELCRERDAAAVIVLGHPEYYGRFGFSAGLAGRLASPYSGPAFMALELSEGSLARGGVVRYPAAFDLVD